MKASATGKPSRAARVARTASCTEARCCDIINGMLAGTTPSKSNSKIGGETAPGTPGGTVLADMLTEFADVGEENGPA